MVAAERTQISPGSPEETSVPASSQNRNSMIGLGKPEAPGRSCMKCPVNAAPVPPLSVSPQPAPASPSGVFCLYSSCRSGGVSAPPALTLAMAKKSLGSVSTRLSKSSSMVGAPISTVMPDSRTKRSASSASHLYIRYTLRPCRKLMMN